MRPATLTVICLVLAGGLWAWQAQQKTFTPPAEFAGVPGVKVFFDRECAQCHSVAALKNTKATLGPRLDGIAQRAAERVEGVSAREYVRQSILDPEAFVVEGYLKVMPVYQETIDENELELLIDWLMQLPPTEATGKAS